MAETKAGVPIVGGLIDAETTHLFSAPPRSGKTWCGLDLVTSATTGTPFAGIFPVSDPVKALYVSDEDAGRRIYERLMGLLRGRGITADGWLPADAWTWIRENMPREW